MKTWYRYAFVYSIISICSPIIMIMAALYTSFLSLVIVEILSSMGMAVETATNFANTVAFFFVIFVALLVLVGMMGIVGSIMLLIKKKTERRKGVGGIIMSAVGTLSIIALVMLFYWLGSIG